MAIADTSFIYRPTQRTHIGTHKGHHCQEGVRSWPGDYARRRAGLTVLLDPSSQLPVLPAARPGVTLERPQPRSGEDERAGRRQAAEDPQERGRLVAVGLSGVVCWFPERGWRSDLTSTHPAPPWCGRCH